MINEKDVVLIGRFAKLHGVSGELVLILNVENRRESVEKILICRIDGLWVPFFVKDRRERGERSILVKLDGINSQEQAGKLCHCEVGVMQKEETEPSMLLPVTGHQWLGYTLRDVEGKTMGKIMDVDESTENVLLSVMASENRIFLFPAAKELILSIDSKKQMLTVTVPEGLFEL
ncbi:MAG: ribosome maturation factor RimM [Tannerellaceae bacterium]|jgi:16S rRNA processing protein RimM|nr:ribosome maturation factor RimM [Tannerellaceae bacterium]